MRGKMLLLVGVGIGYVLGARAGRARYLQLTRMVKRFWSDPSVKRRVDEAEDFVKDRAPEFADFVAESARRLATEALAARRSRRTPSSPGSSAPGTSL